MGKLYSAIKQLDSQIRDWERIANDFPSVDEYKNAIMSLRQHRTELSNKMKSKNKTQKLKRARYEKAKLMSS